MIWQDSVRRKFLIIYSINKSHIIIRLRNPYLPVFESDKRLIETDKLIWFPAKNPAKNSLAGFFFLIRLFWRTVEYCSPFFILLKEILAGLS